MFGLQTGMPSIKVVPEEDGSRVAYTQVQEAFGNGAPGALQVVSPKADADRAAAVAKADRGVAQLMPAMPGRGEKPRAARRPLRPRVRPAMISPASSASTRWTSSTPGRTR